MYTSKAISVQRRKEQEKKALKHHIYLPAVEKTLKMFHSPWPNAFDERLVDSASEISTASRPAAKAKASAPIGVNLLSSQLKVLQNELARQTGQGASDMDGSSSSSLWCPQPPRTAANASYRSARFAQPLRTDTDIEGSSVLSDNESWGTPSLFYSESRSSQQETSEYLTATPSDGDSRSSASSLETHVLRALEGRDRDSSQQLSSEGEFRFGLDSADDDDDFTLLQAFEPAATLEREDELVQERADPEVSQPTLAPSGVSSSSQESILDVTASDAPKLEQSEVESTSDSAPEDGQENPSDIGETGRVESLGATHEHHGREEFNSAAQHSEGCSTESDGDPEANRVSSSTDTRESDLQPEVAPVGVQATDDLYVQEDKAHEPGSVNAGDASAVVHDIVKPSDIGSAPARVDEVSSIEMADDARVERHEDSATKNDSAHEQTEDDSPSQLSDPASVVSTSSSAVGPNEGVQQSASVNDKLSNFDALHAKAEDAAKAAEYVVGPAFYAEIASNPVEFANVSSPIEASVSTSVPQQDSNHQESSTISADEVADNVSTQSLPGSPVLSEAHARAHIRETTPVVEQLMYGFQPSLQDLFQKIAGDSAASPDDDEPSSPPAISGSQAGNEYEADFEDGEDEKDPGYDEFEDES